MQSFKRNLWTDRRMDAQTEGWTEEQTPYFIGPVQLWLGVQKQISQYNQIL